MAIRPILLSVAVWGGATVGGCGQAVDPETPRLDQASTGLTPDAAAGSTDRNSTVHPHDLGGIEVALMGLTRKDDTVTARWRYRSLASEGAPPSTGLDEAPAFEAAPSEAYLVDPVHEKKYLVLTNEAGEPIVGKQASAGTMETGQTLDVWAKFPAPPDGVDRLWVYTPQAPPFRDAQLDQ